MADPTSVVVRDTAIDVERQDFIIKTSEALVCGGFAAIDTSTGKIEFADDATKLMNLGYVLGPQDGNNDHLTGNATYRGVIRAGVIVKNVSVTGVTAVTDFGKFVYPTDGQTLTLTRPTSGNSIGFVAKWNSSTYVDLFCWSLETAILLSRIADKDTIFLGNIGVTAMQGTGASSLIALVARRHYTIDALYAYPAGYDNAAIAGSHDLNLDIDGVNTTGGVLTLAYTSCDAVGDLGNKISSTAITAANEIHVGSTLTLETAGGTGFTADLAPSFNVYMDVTYLPGA